MVQRKGSESQLREMAEHRAPEYPDDQERNRRPFKFLAVDKHLRMSDDTPDTPSSAMRHGRDTTSASIMKGVPRGV